MILDKNGNKLTLDDLEWYCDGCGVRLDYQPGFRDLAGQINYCEWTCTECGFKNAIAEWNVEDDDLTVTDD